MRPSRAVWITWVSLVLPLLVTVVWLRRNDHFPPTFDCAMIEMRVRDVGTAHTPLVGLPGRLGMQQSASHPGPLAFYLLAPIHRLFGGSAWAFRASAAILSALAMTCALVLARRRTGDTAVIATGAGLALLQSGFGVVVSTEPWNPNFPVLWFPVFLLAVWGVLEGDVKLLAIATSVGSICAQTHIPYLPVCAALGLGAALATLVYWLRARRGTSVNGRPARALLLAGAVGLVLWWPPLLEELRGHPGNLSQLAEYFAHAAGLRVGSAAAARILLEHLDPRALTLDALLHPGTYTLGMPPRAPSMMVGSVLATSWCVSIAVATKLRVESLLSLHALVAAVALAEWLAVRQIVGPPFVYLVFFGWSLGMLMLLATVASFASYARARGMFQALPPGPKLLAFAALLVGAIGVRTASSAPDAWRSSIAAVEQQQLSAIAPRVAQVLHLRPGDGPYLITWDVWGGGRGIGLVNELERRAVRAMGSTEHRLKLGAHRVLKARQAAARVHLATGDLIDEVRAQPSAVEVAYSDGRTAQQRAEFEKTKKVVAAGMIAAGHGDRVALLDRDLLRAFEVEQNPYLQLGLYRMGELGVPAAVFVMPAERRRQRAQRP